MYQRSYPQTEHIPPNYKGNAFDPPGNDETENPCERCDKCESCEKREHAEPPKPEKEENSGISSLFTRRDGSPFALDDIILGGLIVLLLNSHADDELLLVLVLLFISGI